MLIFTDYHITNCIAMNSCIEQCPPCVVCTSCWFQGFGKEGRLRSTHTSLRTSSSVGSFGRRSKYGNWASSAWPEGGQSVCVG